MRSMPAFARACLVVGSLVALLALAGCDTLSGSRDYSNAGRLPPLEVPPDLARPQADTRFNLPEGAAGSATFSEFDRQRQSKAKPGETGLLPIVDRPASSAPAASAGWCCPGLPRRSGRWCATSGSRRVS